MDEEGFEKSPTRVTMTIYRYKANTIYSLVLFSNDPFLEIIIFSTITRRTYGNRKATLEHKNI